MLNYFNEIWVFIFGLCIGSFLNVCIYRLPESKSIVHPGSMCPNCGTPIRFYDNIPILSYVWLKGKCRHCHARISLRY
ncbi:MAG: prepilin peptidase, partial [Desulfobacterales bacterium]